MFYRGSRGGGLVKVPPTPAGRRTLREALLLLFENGFRRAAGTEANIEASNFRVSSRWEFWPCVNFCSMLLMSLVGLGPGGGPAGPAEWLLMTELFRCLRFYGVS